MDMLSNCPVNTYVYTQRPVLLLVLGKHVFVQPASVSVETDNK